MLREEGEGPILGGGLAGLSIAMQLKMTRPETRVLVTVAGYGTPKTVCNVSLSLNGRVTETKTAEVPENGRATVEFLSLDVPYGRNKGEVKIDSADGLAADDTFYFSVERSDPRHALFVHEADSTRGLLYFKAALEASVRYLAADLGAKNIRVNAISAGPIKTLAASGISGFSSILQVYRERAPLKRNVEAGEVADTAVFLLSSAARGITGEIVMVDAGFHVAGGA